MSSGRHYAAKLYYKTQEAAVFSKWLEAETQLEQGNPAEADRMIQDALNKTSDLTAECLRRELASRNYAAGTELARQVNALANPDAANDLKLHALPHELEDIVPRRRLLVRAAISSRRGSDPVESQQHAFAAAMQAALPSAPGMALCGYDAMLFLASNDTLQDYYSQNAELRRYQVHIGQEGDLCADLDKPLLSLKHKGIRGEAREGRRAVESMVYFGFLRYAEIVLCGDLKLSSAHDSVRHNIWHRPWATGKFLNGKRETIRAFGKHCDTYGDTWMRVAVARHFFVLEQMVAIAKSDASPTDEMFKDLQRDHGINQVDGDAYPASGAFLLELFSGRIMAEYLALLMRICFDDDHTHAHIGNRPEGPEVLPSMTEDYIESARWEDLKNEIDAANDRGSAPFKEKKARSYVQQVVYIALADKNVRWFLRTQAWVHQFNLLMAWVTRQRHANMLVLHQLKTISYLHAAGGHADSQAQTYKEELDNNWKDETGRSPKSKDDSGCGSIFSCASAVVTASEDVTDVLSGQHTLRRNLAEMLVQGILEQGILEQAREDTEAGGVGLGAAGAGAAAGSGEAAAAAAAAAGAGAAAGSGAAGTAPEADETAAAAGPGPGAAVPDAAATAPDAAATAPAAAAATPQPPLPLQQLPAETLEEYHARSLTAAVNREPTNAQVGADVVQLSDRIGNYFEFAKENPWKCIVDVAQLGWNIVTLPFTAVREAIKMGRDIAVIAAVGGGFYLCYQLGLFGELINAFTTPGNATDIQDFNMRLHMGNATVLPHVEQPDLFLPGLAGEMARANATPVAPPPSPPGPPLSDRVGVAVRRVVGKDPTPVLPPSPSPSRSKQLLPWMSPKEWSKTVQENFEKRSAPPGAPPPSTMAISYYDSAGEDLSEMPPTYVEMVEEIKKAGDAWERKQDAAAAARAAESELAAARVSESKAKRQKNDNAATVKYAEHRKGLREANLEWPSKKDPTHLPGQPGAPGPVQTEASIGAPPPTGATSASASALTPEIDFGGMLAWLLSRADNDGRVHSTGTLAADTTALVYQSRAMRGPIRVLSEGETSKEDAMDLSDGEKGAVDRAVAKATPPHTLTRSTTAAIQAAADAARKEYLEQRERARKRLLPTVFCMEEARRLAARADREAGVCRAFSLKRRRDSDEGDSSTPVPRRQRSVRTPVTPVPPVPRATSMEIDAGAVALNAVRLAQLTVDSQWCGVRRAR